LHAHNLNFKINHARDKTKLWKYVVFKECDVQKRCIGLGMDFDDVRDFQCESHVTECMTRLAKKDKHKDMIIAWNENSQERRVLAQLIALIALMMERKISLAFYRIFFLLSTWKTRIC
jgi:hypothetical protein